MTPAIALGEGKQHVLVAVVVAVRLVSRGWSSSSSTKLPSLIRVFIPAPVLDAVRLSGRFTEALIAFPSLPAWRPALHVFGVHHVCALLRCERRHFPSIGEDGDMRTWGYDG